MRQIDERREAGRVRRTLGNAFGQEKKDGGAWQHSVLVLTKDAFNQRLLHLRLERCLRALEEYPYLEDFEHEGAEFE